MLRDLRLHHLKFVGATAATLTVAAIVYFTNPLPTLQAADAKLMLLAGTLSGLSVLSWSGAWVFTLAKSRRGVSFGDSLAVSMASNVGLLTPLNIGTDLLRSLYARKVLGCGYNLTAAVSVVTRTFRLHVTLALLLLVAFVSVFATASSARAMIIPIAAVLALLGALYSLRTGTADRIAQRLGIGDLSDPIRQVTRSVAAAAMVAIYLTFAAGFVLEWLSLHMCLHAVGETARFTETLTLFALLFVLSRTPVIPQGLGLVEVGGFAMLSSMSLTAAHAGAILIMWDSIRILVPLGLSLVFSVWLGVPRVHLSVNQGDRGGF